MEIRVYFKEEELRACLKKTGLYTEDPKPYYHGMFFEDREGHPPYLKLNEIINLGSLPSVVKEVGIVGISLYETISLEQNLHIKQGIGKEGSTHYRVWFDEEKYSVSNSENDHIAFAYRAVIKIRIKGNKTQSVEQAYQKIRAGESDGSYKGEAVVPKHCIVTPDLV